MVELNPLIHTPVADTDVVARVPHCQAVLYEDMHKYPTLESLLRPPTKILILYELAKVGHFCCLFYNTEGLQFFDPLGGKPDSELDHLSNPYWKSKWQDYPYLVRLLVQSQEPVIYSPYHLQAHHTSTCGCWSAIRMIYSDLLCDEFAHCFDYVRNRDIAVARLYYDLPIRKPMDA